MQAQQTRRGGRHCLEQRGGLETGEQTSESTTVEQALMPFQPATATIAELLSEHERVEMWTLRERLAAHVAEWRFQSLAPHGATAEEWSGDDHHPG